MTEQHKNKELLEKALIIYKGDKLMAAYYVGFATTLLLSAVFLYFFTLRIGWFYLAIGLFILGIFCMVKGIFIYRVAYNRHKFYSEKSALSVSDVKSESDYNMYRLEKKQLNRRRYLYSLVFCFILLVLGILAGEKGFSIGTLVPIMLYAGTEFCVTLLTEFRLWEYQRQLEKES